MFFNFIRWFYYTYFSICPIWFFSDILLQGRLDFFFCNTLPINLIKEGMHLQISKTLTSQSLATYTMEQFLDNIHCLSRKILRINRFIQCDISHQCLLSSISKRRFSCQQFVKKNTQCPQIYILIVWLLQYNFRSQILRSSHKWIIFVFFIHKLLRQTEIWQLNVAIASY